MVEDAKIAGDVTAISLTSGVAESRRKRLTIWCRSSGHSHRFNLPIGVSVYPTTTSSEDLHAAGASEIKYNVETMVPAIFSRVCPGLSLDYILSALENAVQRPLGPRSKNDVPPLHGLRPRPPAGPVKFPADFSGHPRHHTYNLPVQHRGCSRSHDPYRAILP